jgi:hypothetical protein
MDGVKINNDERQPHRWKNARTVNREAIRQKNEKKNTFYS